MIVLYWCFRRIVLEMSSPSEADVHIFRVAIAIQFPHSGHRHRAPAAVVEVGAVEVGGPLVSILHPIKLPVAVQRHYSSMLVGVA